MDERIDGGNLDQRDTQSIMMSKPLKTAANQSSAGLAKLSSQAPRFLTTLSKKSTFVDRSAETMSFIAPPLAMPRELASNQCNASIESSKLSVDDGLQPLKEAEANPGKKRGNQKSLLWPQSRQVESIYMKAPLDAAQSRVFGPSKQLPRDTVTAPGSTPPKTNSRPSNMVVSIDRLMADLTTTSAEPEAQVARNEEAQSELSKQTGLEADITALLNISENTGKPSKPRDEPSFVDLARQRTKAIKAAKYPELPQEATRSRVFGSSRKLRYD